MNYHVKSERHNLTFEVKDVDSDMVLFLGYDTLRFQERNTKFWKGFTGGVVAALFIMLCTVVIIAL